MHLRTIRSSFLFAPIALEAERCRALRRAARGEHECRRPTWAVATAAGLTSFLGPCGALRGSSALSPSSLALSHVWKRPITVRAMGGRDQVRRFASDGRLTFPGVRRGSAPRDRGKGLERLSTRRTSSVMREPRSLWREGRPTIQGNALCPQPHPAPLALRVRTRAGRDLRSVRCTLGSPSAVEGVVIDAVGRWGGMPATLTLRPGAVSR